MFNFLKILCKWCIPAYELLGMVIIAHDQVNDHQVVDN